MSDRTFMSSHPARHPAQAYQAVSWVGPSADDAISNRPTRRTPATGNQSMIITNPGIVHAQLHYYQWLPTTVTTAGASAVAPASLQPSPWDTYIPQGYPQSRPPSSPQKRDRGTLTCTTRNPSPRLPPMIQPMEILSSERYDDGVVAARRSSRGQEPQQMISVFGLIQDQKDESPERKTGRASQRQHDGEPQTGSERRRKKQKLSSEDEADDDAAKKARGRPRLDTKDETAADRRRTQIRMAQRAYRHRKESTIASLEKQVQDLRSTNEQMSSIFINFHDYAVGKGLVRGDPELGNHLKATTEQFLALAKSMSSDENGKDEEGTSADGSKHWHSDADADKTNRSGKAQRNELLPAQPESPTPWGCYEVLHEPVIDEQRNQISWESQPFMAPPPRQDHQIISRATFDNASFGFDMLDFDNLQQYRAEVPDYYQNLVAFQESLPLTKSLAQHETTFGRHLQRAALERGWKLISAKNPNPTRLNEVFGFCLRFETREAIMLRLKSSLETSSKDALFDWRAPFVHLGGSGTYYPLDEDISGTMAPKFRTGMSMGPFSPPVVNTRETAMIDDFRINLPGFEGEFFDSNDVEGYLRGRGLDIPPNVEFVTVDLDLLDVRDSLSPQSESNKPYSPVTPKSPEVRFNDLTGQDERLASQIDEYAMHVTNRNSNQIKDLDINFSSVSFPDWNGAMAQKQLSGNSANNNPFDITGPIFNAIPMPQNAMTAASSIERQFHESHLVTLSVTVLVEEILSHAICLGRAPGFRPADVEAALRRTLRKAF